MHTASPPDALAMTPSGTLSNLHERGFDSDFF